MILRKLTVGGWRCFTEEVELGPFAPGLNLVHARNGSGKSTLFEALRRGLLDSHTLAGKEIDSIRPWGRELSPKVVVEFEHAGQTNRVRKRFLDAKESRLERLESGTFRAVAEGRAADEETRDILTKDAPGRGAFKQEHWGIAQVLWAPQGSLALPSLTDGLVGAIRTALGQEVEDAGGPLEERIGEAYLSIFTKTGRVAKNSTLQQLQDALASAGERVTSAEALLQDYQKAASLVEELRSTAGAARQREDVLTARVAEARTRASAYNGVRGEVERLQSALESARVRYESADEKVWQLETLQERIRDNDAKLSKVTGELAAWQRELEGHARAVEAAAKARDEANSAAKQLTAERDALDVARRYTAAKAEFDEKRSRLERAKEAEADVKAARTERDEYHAPEASDVEDLREALASRDRARAAIDAALMTLEIVPHTDAAVEVLEGEDPGTRKATADTPLVVKGTPGVVVELEGVARLRASGPAVDIDEERATLKQAEADIQYCVEQFGSSNPRTLQERREKAGALQAAVDKAQTRLDTELRDDSLETLRAGAARAESTVQAILEQHREWADAPPGVAAMETALEERERRFAERREQAESALESARNARDAAAEAHRERQAEHESLKTSLDNDKEALEHLLKEAGDEQALRKHRGEMAVALQAAEASLARKQEELEAFEGDPEADLEMAEGAMKENADELRKNLEEVARAEGQLDSLAAKGPYSEVNEAREQLARLEEERDREQLRADAIQLLHDTVAGCRAAAVEAVAAPVQRLAKQYLERITGRPLGELHLGEDLCPDELTPTLATDRIGVENLSGGECEQLFLATRLALAHALTDSERQLMVLDDVLIATDAGRFGRILRILREAASRMQVLILTCHPDRYYGLDVDATFDLEDLVRRAQG